MQMTSPIMHCSMRRLAKRDPGIRITMFTSVARTPGSSGALGLSGPQAGYLVKEFRSSASAGSEAGAPLNYRRRRNLG